LVNGGDEWLSHHSYLLPIHTSKLSHNYNKWEKSTTIKFSIK
jgi:hypothetical protein